MKHIAYASVLTISTSNRASASITIRDIARVLDSSLMTKDSQEHEPSGWSPDGQKLVRRLSSRPARSLSQICEESCEIVNKY